MVTSLFVAARRLSPRCTLAVAVRWFLPGALFGLSYVALFEAFYRGPVSVVSPLVGDRVAVGRRPLGALPAPTERVGLRLVLGATLVVAGAC